MEKIKYGYSFDDKGSPTIVGASVNYIQPCDLDGNNIQEISIKLNDVGGGPYLTIETNRWSFDDVDDFVKILNDFKRRIDI